MKTKYSLIIFLLSILVSHAQGEANIWYFGTNAGVDFNSGSPVALTNGQLNTSEGCATISNSSGQLLFYTDGITVWNKNHVVMPNGTGLSGDSSSTQSATIVPKPGSNTLFYVFTLDAFAGANGFQYSEVDISLDNGNGAVTSNKNILLYTPSCEKLAIVKHANNTDFWVVTHQWNSNNFVSYLLTSTGLDIANPIISSVGTIINGTTDNVWGQMKISPDGSKLGICNSFINAEIFDFNNNTGTISNPTVLFTQFNCYGLEFSPNSQVLYITNIDGDTPVFKIIQYDLSNSSTINTSEQTIYTSLSNNQAPASLQLGSDGKIYIAQINKTSLSVIDNPNQLGSTSNIQINAVDLLGKVCQFGLPPFVSSFLFNPAIQLQNACVGEATSFELNNSAVTSTTWDFGDGSSSTLLNPTHTYTTSGTFTVSVVATSPNGTGTNTRDIIISEVPTATQPNEIKICDSNNDGVSSFDLTQQNNSILNGQLASQYNVTYFANATDYASNTSIADPSSYTNTVAYGQQTIIAVVSNNANPNCKATTNFTIQVFKTPIISTTALPALRICDDSSFGTDTDGKAVFDLTQNQSAILNGQSNTEFSVSYYTDSGFTNTIATPNNYVNTTAIETIYVKISTIANPNCFVITSFQIEVYSLPIVNTMVTLKQCDDDNDGFSSFNLMEAQSLLVTNPNSFTFAFFETFADAQNNVSPINSLTNYTNQMVSNDMVVVKVTNTNGCFRIVQLNLVVTTTSIPTTFQKTFFACDNLASGSITDGISSFDFSSVITEVQALYPTGQLLTITYYKNLIDALAEQNAITNISNYSNVGYPNSQNIYIRVDSQVNNECLGLGHHITLTVEPIPVVQPLVIKHCDEDQDGIYNFDTSTLESDLLNGLTDVTISYTDQNGNPLQINNPFVTSSQIINVKVKKLNGQQCEYNSTIEFIVDDLPEAFPIPTSLTTVCDDETNPTQQNGLFAFDTSTFEMTLLGNQTGMIVNYFDANNVALSSPLPNPFVSGTQTIRVEVINPINTTCKTILYIPFIVNPNPSINLVGNELICSDNPTFTKLIDAGLINPSTQNNYTYSWFLNNVLLPNETNYTLNVNTEGIYTVIVENQNGCSSTRTITVTASNSAIIEDIVITDLSATNSIEIITSGLGDYVYSLNNNAYQVSPVFSPVSPGQYTISIKDLKGCTTINEMVYVMGIPKFFTPNGDGYNDLWNINYLNPSLNLKVSIFDRYGKLLNQFNPKNRGWDGNYNGHTLPATDYWFLIEFENGRTVKSHFSLLR